MGSTPFEGFIGFFLKNLFSNIRSHIKDSKWGRKCAITNCVSHKGSLQQIALRQHNLQMRQNPPSRCRAFWVLTIHNLLNNLFAKYLKYY